MNITANVLRKPHQKVALMDFLKKKGLNREQRRQEMKKNWRKYFNENKKKSNSRNA